MTDRPIDSWRDTMVAALYGELSDDEMREFEALLEQHDELRHDWQELLQVRAGLQRLAREDEEPSFAFRLPPAQATAEQASKVVPLWRWAVASAAGFAAAASIFLVLLTAGLRVDRTAGGVLVRFGGTAGEATAVSQAVDDSAAWVGQETITRAEFAALADALIGATAARLDELERRQVYSQAEVARALYDALAVQQQRQYDNLTSQIQLALLRSGGANPALTGQGSWNPALEGNRNDTQ
jgi:hypothetical protein